MTGYGDFNWVDKYGWSGNQPGPEVQDMMFPVRCTACGRVYDLAKVKVTARYTDCSVWKCPGCGLECDDRPPGWGAHHYVELPKRTEGET